MKIAIVGAGIIGAATAHALLDAGHEIVIVDQEGPAAGASRGNAGWIAHTDILPLASFQTIWKVPGFLFDPLGPLSIRPNYFFQLLPWLVRFAAAARPSAYERSMNAIAAIQQKSLPAWKTLAQQLGLASHIHVQGTLTVFDRTESYENAKKMAARQHELGIAVHALTGKELHELEPGLSERACAAFYYPGAAHVSDPLDFTQAIYDKAIERKARAHRGKVKAVLPGTVLTLIMDDQEPIQADKVIVAAGAWSRELAKGLGESIPLDTERGYNVHFAHTGGILQRPALFDGHGFVATELETGLRLGGAVEFAGLNAAPNHLRTEALYQKALLFMPDLPAFENGKTWMGFRPSLPDSLPVIGRSVSHHNIFYAFGHGHYGLTQAAITAQLIKDLILERTPAISLSPYRPDRF